MPRLWAIAVVAETFHVLPTVAARDLDRDPEQLSLAVLPLLRYAELKGIFDRAQDETALKPYRGDALMDSVMRNWAALVKERKAAAKAAREKAGGR